MTTIYCRITDGDNITAVRSIAKAKDRIRESDPDLTAKQVQEIFDREWREVYLT